MTLVLLNVLPTIQKKNFDFFVPAKNRYHGHFCYLEGPLTITLDFCSPKAKAREKEKGSSEAEMDPYPGPPMDHNGPPGYYAPKK